MRESERGREAGRSVGTGEGELYADRVHWPLPGARGSDSPGGGCCSVSPRGPITSHPGPHTVDAVVAKCPSNQKQRTVSPPAEEQNTILLHPAGRNSDGLATVLVHRGHVLGGQRAEVEAPVPPDCTAAAPTGPHSPRHKRETSVSHREGAVFPVSTTHS